MHSDPKLARLYPDPATSAEGRLVERPELAAVQLRPFAPQLVAHLDADPHMLADRALVEAVGAWPGSFSSPWSGLSGTQSSVPFELPRSLSLAERH
jgi:hypothetical protein